MFNKVFKNKNNNNKKFLQIQKSEKDLNIKLINNLDSIDDDYSSIVQFNKNMNFTNLYKLQQNINEINEVNDINTATRFSTPKRLTENRIKKIFE